MKDPNYDASYTEAWVGRRALQQLRDTGNELKLEDPFLSINARKLKEPLLPTNLEKLKISGRAAPETSGTLSKCKITGVSHESLAALRSLPKEANILLLTPVIVPAGNAETYREDPHSDPFEQFGKALSKHHKRIRHVPYLATVGLTEIHKAFIDEADAMITMVCEPCHGKLESLEWQMDFAEDAVDALQSKADETPNTLVLIECGEEEYRPPADGTFDNVIESASYNDEVAKQIAYAIFKAVDRGIF